MEAENSSRLFNFNPEMIRQAAENFLAARAIPVICEVDDTLTLDPRDVRKKITPQTRTSTPQVLGHGKGGEVGPRFFCREFTIP